MTASELIEILQEVNGDTEVIVATQPSYPIAHAIKVATPVLGDDNDSSPDRRSCVWIATDGSPYDRNPYAPSHAWEGEVVDLNALNADEECEDCGGELDSEGICFNCNPVHAHA